VTSQANDDAANLIGQDVVLTHVKDIDTNANVVIPGQGANNNSGIEQFMRQIALVTYLVREYAEPTMWFQNALGFRVFEDTDMGGDKRWVVVGPDTSSGARFLLAKASSHVQSAFIDKAARGRVAFFLHTDDFHGEHESMLKAGLKFLEAPRQEPYGTVAVFEDLYGNRWDLIEPLTPLQ